MSSDPRMHVNRMSIDNCARIKIQPDLENGCVELFFFDERGHSWTKFTLLVFGVGNDPPGIELAEPLQLRPEEVDADEQDVVG